MILLVLRHIALLLIVQARVMFEVHRIIHSPVIICLKFYESSGSLLSHVASTVPDCEDILSGPLFIMKFDLMLISGSLIISHEKVSSCSSHSFAALVCGFLFHMLTLDIDSGIIYVDFGFLFFDDDKFLNYLLSRHAHRKGEILQFVVDNCCLNIFGDVSCGFMHLVSLPLSEHGIIVLNFQQFSAKYASRQREKLSKVHSLTATRELMLQHSLYTKSRDYGCGSFRLVKVRS